MRAGALFKQIILFNLECVRLHWDYLPRQKNSLKTQINSSKAQTSRNEWIKNLSLRANTSLFKVKPWDKTSGDNCVLLTNSTMHFHFFVTIFWHVKKFIIKTVLEKVPSRHNINLWNQFCNTLFFYSEIFSDASHLYILCIQ